MRARLPPCEVNGELRGESERAEREIGDERTNIHPINQSFQKKKNLFKKIKI